MKVIGGIGLAKKDILGARSVVQILQHENDTITRRRTDIMARMIKRPILEDLRR